MPGPKPYPNANANVRSIGSFRADTAAIFNPVVRCWAPCVEIVVEIVGDTAQLNLALSRPPVDVVESVDDREDDGRRDPAPKNKPRGRFWNNWACLFVFFAMSNN